VLSVSWYKYITEGIRNIRSPLSWRKFVSLVPAPAQRRYTKKLPRLYNVPYLERIRKLKLERLDVRRLRFDILFVYKMLFGLVLLDFRMFFTLSPFDNTRGHCYKLLIPSSKIFFSVRIVEVWNELPASTYFSTLRIFSNSIHKIDLARYCNGL